MKLDMAVQKRKPRGPQVDREQWVENTDLDNLKFKIVLSEML